MRIWNLKQYCHTASLKVLGNNELFVKWKLSLSIGILNPGFFSHITLLIKWSLKSHGGMNVRLLEW